MLPDANDSSTKQPTNIETIPETQITTRVINWQIKVLRGDDRFIYFTTTSVSFTLELSCLVLSFVFPYFEGGKWREREGEREGEAVGERNTFIQCELDGMG